MVRPEARIRRLHGGLRLNRLNAALAGAVMALAGVLAGNAYAAAAPDRGRGPLVVELFSAQGCDSCPEANRLIEELGERDRVIALTYPVDYWDYLGWRDTFAKPEFTARQRAYVGRLGLKEVYTPEVIINGRREAAGVDADKLDDLVEAEAERRSLLRRPSILVLRGGRRIGIGKGSPFSEPADVWVVRFDPNRREVRVRAGDNQGELVPHFNVVREIHRLGPWNGAQRNFRLPEPVAGLRTVILVQGAKGGPILAARLLP
jgi:hypothetical protein